MNDEEAFLAAIAAAPDDLAPRLVFADWLEERGDPRGPWLRDPDIGPWLGPRCEDPVPRLIAALPERPDAGPVLVRLGAVAVRALLQALRVPDPESREPFRAVLAQLTEHLRPFVPALEADLNSSDPVVRDAAIVALSCLGDLGDSALGPLVSRLESPNSAIRDAALDALGDLGPAAARAVPRVLELWRREADARTGTAFRERAAAALGRIAPAGAEAIPVLAAALAHPVLQPSVLGALQQFGPAAIDPLVAALNRLDAQGGMSVLMSLTAMSPDPTTLFVGLLADTKFGSRGRQAVAQWLGVFGSQEVGHVRPRASELLSALDRATRSETPDIRSAALEAMVRVGPQADRTRAALRRGLVDPEQAVRTAAWDGYVAAESIPLAAREARDLIRGSDPADRAAVAEMLGRLLDHAEEADEYAVDEYGVALDPDEAAGDTGLDGAVVDAIRLLLRALEDRNRSVRSAAARVLGESIPSDVDEAIDPLLTALDDPAPAVRGGAALALARLDDYHEDAIPALLRVSRDSEPEAAWAALTALGALRVDDPAVLRALRAALRSPEPWARAGAARGFADWDRLPESIGREVPDLLRDPDATVRYHALAMADAVDAEDADERALAAYRRALADPDRDVREQAWDMLTDLDEKSVDRAVGDLVRAWTVETDEDLAGYLGTTVQDCPSRGPALAPLLESPDARVRVRALEALAGAGPSAAAAVPGLIAELDRADETTWRLALDALVGIGPAAAPALPRLMTLLDDQGETTALAARIIGTLGAAGLSALARLEALAQEDDGYARYAAIEAIATLSVETDRAAPVVRTALSGDDVEATRAAVEGLARLGERAAPFLPDLVARLRRSQPDERSVASLTSPIEDPDLWQQIIDAIGAMGLAAASAVPELARATEDAIDEVCLAAARALGATGAESAVEPLRRALFAADLRLRAEAARSLGRLGSTASAAVPDLCRAAADPRWARGPQGEIDREEALDALAAMGAGAAHAVPTLGKLLDDPDEDVRCRAAAVLAAIGPAAAAALRRARRHRDPAVRAAAGSAGDKSADRDRRGTSRD